jgi:hypothetical protein
MKEGFMLKVRMPKKRKHRGHKVLFDRDFNFRGRMHDDKHEYRRKPKNNRWDDYSDY